MRIKKIVFILIIILLSVLGMYHMYEESSLIKKSNNNTSDKSEQLYNDEYAISSGSDSERIESDTTKETTIDKINSVGDALNQAIEIAKTKSDDRKNAISEMLKDNDTSKYEQKIESLLGKNKDNLDLTNKDNLDKYIENKLYVNSSQEAIDLYEKTNPIENRTPVFIFNTNNISEISLHSGDKSQYSYEDFKDYNGTYIRLEDCTFDYLFGNGNIGNDSLYTILLYAYYPSSNKLDKNLNLKLLLDYSDDATLNYTFDKNKKFTIEGKVAINEGGDSLYLTKGRVID